MTLFELAKQVSKLKTNDGIHRFASYAKWYCIYYKKPVNEQSYREAFKSYRKSPQY